MISSKRPNTKPRAPASAASAKSTSKSAGRRSLRSRWANESPRKTATISAACRSPRTTSAASKTHNATRSARRTDTYSGKRTKVLGIYPKEPSLFTRVCGRGFLRSSCEAFEISIERGLSISFLQEGTLLGGFDSLVRAYHQHWAGSVADNRIRDTPLDGPPYPPVAPAAHHDQVRSKLLGQGHDLQVHLPHPEVSPCHGAPGDLHPPGLFAEQLPGHLFELLVELAFVAEHPGIALQENGYHSDVHQVQLGVGPFGQVHGPQGGQFGLFGAVGSE